MEAFGLFSSINIIQLTSSKQMFLNMSKIQTTRLEKLNTTTNIKAVFTLQANAAQIWFLLTLCNHICFFIGQSECDKSIFFKSSTSFSYLVLNLIHTQCFSKQMHSERGCHISFNFYDSEVGMCGLIQVIIMIPIWCRLNRGSVHVFSYRTKV